MSIQERVRITAHTDEDPFRIDELGRGRRGRSDESGEKRYSTIPWSWIGIAVGLAAFFYCLYEALDNKAG